MDIKELLLSVLRAYDAIMWMYPSLFNQSLTAGHLSCSCLQNIFLLQNGIAMNNLVHPSFWVFISFLGQIPLETGARTWIGGVIY